MVTIGLAGDTMLGRKVGDLLAVEPDAEVFDPGVHAATATADLLLLNLECCISSRGDRWAGDPGKPFFFRAPPAATRVLTDLGTDVVTLANNHALDFGPTALRDTTAHLDAVGIVHVGAGATLEAARAPTVVDVDGLRVGIVGASDHPRDFAAAPGRPGIAWWDHGRDHWVLQTVRDLRGISDVVIATVHWGPNMVASPGRAVRLAGERLVEAGASIVAGHSAHVFHGVEWQRGDTGPVPVLYDLGDLVDDYAVHPTLRNDLGALWFVHLDGPRPVAVEALPLTLAHCHTRVASGPDRAWVEHRLTQACAPFGTIVVDDGTRLSCRPPTAARA